MGFGACLFNILNSFWGKSRNKILFFSGFEYEDSARAVCEYLMNSKRYNDYRIVWLLNNPKNSKSIPPRITCYRRKSIKGLIAYLSSKYVFTTHMLFGYSCGNKQMIVNLWHGMPLKGIKKTEVEREHFNRFAAVTITSPAFKQVLYPFVFAREEAYVDCGLPRNDQLFVKHDILRKILPKDYRRVIIWAPTFRRKNKDSVDGSISEFGVPCIKEKDLKVINTLLKELDYCLIFKLHPWASDAMCELSSYSNIFNISNSDIPDGYVLYNLIGASDALITDYSSIYIDYLLLDKPICFAYDDLKEYESTRFFSFSPPEDYMCGPIVNDTNGILGFLRSLSKDDMFVEQRKRIANLFHTHKDGKSTERLMSYLEGTKNAFQ